MQVLLAVMINIYTGIVPVIFGCKLTVVFSYKSHRLRFIAIVVYKNIPQACLHVVKEGCLTLVTTLNMA